MVRLRELSDRLPGEDFSGLLSFLEHDAPNAKENDALALLAAMQACAASGPV